MSEDYLKTRIHILTVNKTIISNVLIVSFGASIGLLIKSLNGNTTTAEIGFIILGLVFSIYLFYAGADVSEEINNLLLQLKEGKKK
jgi:hypothetical protein